MNLNEKKYSENELVSKFQILHNLYFRVQIEFSTAKQELKELANLVRFTSCEDKGDLDA